MENETVGSRLAAARPDLDEHFFHVNPAHHLERRLWSIIALSDMPEKDIPIRKDDPDSLFNRFRRLVEEMPFSEDSNLDEEVSKERLAALEAHSLMHQVMETALRLFVMLSELETGESPWIPLAELPANSEYRRKVKGLLSGTDAAQLAVKVAIPHYGQLVRSLGENQALAHARFVSHWLMFFAELFDQDGYNGAQSHNQMKHGMAAIARDDVKMTFVGNSDRLTVDELNAGYDIINAVSITYLSRKKIKGHAAGWSLRTDNADPALCLAVAQAGICVVRSLWQVSKLKAQPGIANDYEHNAAPLPTDVFARSQSGFQSVSMELVPPIPVQAKAT
ncbi:hypothetical protein [Arthrobacter sp. HLT1-21]